MLWEILQPIYVACPKDADEWIKVWFGKQICAELRMHLTVLMHLKAGSKALLVQSWFQLAL